jgi:PAS domain S-box-containing protein
LETVDDRELTASFLRSPSPDNAFEFLFENASDAIYILDKRGNFVAVNRKAEELTGLKRENYIGKSFREIFPAKSLPKAIRGFLSVIRGKSIRLELELKTAAKKTILVEVTSSPFISDGKTVGTLGIVRDITERNRVEKENKRFAEKLSALNIHSRDLNTAQSMKEIYGLTFDAMKKTLGFEIAFFMVVDGNMLRVVDHLGYPKSFSMALPLDGTKKGISVKAARTGRTIYVPDAEKEADWVEFMPGIRSAIDVPVKIGHEVLGVLGVNSKKLDAFAEKDQKLLEILASHAATAISDIEKRQEIEKRSSQLASLMKSSAEIISTTDLRLRLEKIAEAIKEMGWRRVVLYVTDENLEMRSPEDLVSAGITHEERGFLWKKRQTGQVWRERFGPKYERFRIGGFFYLPWSDPLVRKSFSEDTVPSKLPPEEMVDWDPQDLLFAPLRLADGRFVGMISIDDPLDGRRPTKESLAPLELFIHQAAVAIENAQLFLQLNEAKNRVKEYADQLELKVKQRTQELVEAQNRLLKAERLAAIGEVAAMVGHDLRNPLAGIDGAAYYLKTKFGSNMDQRAKEMFELIEKDIDYSNNIITDLLEYSREIRLEIEAANPKSIVTEALSLVRVPPNIQVADLTGNEPKIEVDSERMKRVFVNIIKNAVDAMPQGGKLIIESKESSGNLEIAFTDTGIGMSKETLNKLWTPLFTTKAKGMGLGLSICRRFVEAHCGHISVKSKEGKGTTFTVIVPSKSKLEGGESTWMNPSESLLSTTMKA